MGGTPRATVVRGVAVLGALLAATGATRDASAWLFVEHTQIGRGAVPGDGPIRTALDAAWDEVLAAPGRQRPHCPKVVWAPGLDPECIDLPMLAAFAADHSCTTAELDSLPKSTWAGKLIRMFAHNYGEIEKQKGADAAGTRVSLWHEGHLLAQLLDPQYLSRANDNAPHFLLPRRANHNRPLAGDLKSDGERFEEYLVHVTRSNGKHNAVRMYAHFHLRALKQARQADCKTAPCRDGAAAREALLSEAFALHFLEDAFSAGHVVGVPAGPGDAESAAVKSVRVGTHDHYCQHGATLTSWDGHTYSAFGDAHMHGPDRSRAANTVAASLAEVAAALVGTDGWWDEPSCPVGEAVDACGTSATFPDLPTRCVLGMSPILRQLPAPPLEDTPMPSPRSEIGPYLKFGSTAGLGIGFINPTGPRRGALASHGQLEANVGLGFSFEGVTTETSDATMYLLLGVAATSAQTERLVLSCGGPDDCAMPPRLGMTARLRLPFAYVPGDAVLFGPMAAGGNRWATQQLAGASSGGALRRMQRLVPLGGNRSFQFVSAAPPPQPGPC